MYTHIYTHGINYETAWKLTCKKAVKYWPQYLCGFFSVLISHCFFRDHLNFKGFSEKLFYAIPEMFYLSWGVNGVAWYMSTLLVGCFVLLLFLAVNKKATIYCIAPLGVYYIYWEMYKALPTIQLFSTYTFSSRIGDWYFRAGAGIALGMIAGQLYYVLQNNDSYISRIARQHGNKFGCLMIVGALLLIKSVPHKLIEYICIVVFFFSIIGLFIGTDIAPRLKRFEGNILQMGEMGFSLYINQYAFSWIVFSKNMWVSTFIIILINLVYGFCTYKFIKYLSGILKHRTL